MNREDIIRMARIAVNGRSAKTLAETQSLIGLDEVERFAALVAAAEREKVAAWMIQRGYATGHGDTIEDLLVELEWQVREAEREEILAFSRSEAFNRQHGERSPYAYELANAIRARWQA